MAQTLGSVAVGTVVKINESGSPVNYLVVHQGLPSSMYDASCNGTWLLRKDIYKNYFWDSGNSNALPGADIFATMAGTKMLSLYDPFIQNAVKTVKIPYCVGNGSSTVRSGANGLLCQFFPLSGYEVGWTTSTNSYFPVDGAKLSYFESGTGSSAKNKRIANLNGRATSWWLRSPNTGGTDSVWRVYSDGNYGHWNANNSDGVRPAFVISQNLYVWDDGTVSQLPGPAPSSITVPANSMVGTSIPVSWGTAPGADSYILQRKVDSGSWTQVYSGTDLTFTDTAGSWTTVQYQVCGVFDGTNGAFAQSEVITVVPASALAVSGTDGDLGTITSDISYSVATDTGNPISLTLTVNGAQFFSGSVGTSYTSKIPVMDLPTGTNTIVITATVTASSGQVTVTRTWTYTKAAVSFPASGGVALLTKNGQNVFPMTLAEAVKTIGGPWGKNLSEALDKMAPFMVSGAKIATGRYKGTGAYGSGNPNTLTFPFEPKVVFLLNQKNSSGIYTSFFATYLNSTPCVNMEAITTEYGTDIGFGYGEAGNRYGKKSADGKTLYWYTTDSAKQANTAGNTYYWLAIG